MGEIADALRRARAASAQERERETPDPLSRDPDSQAATTSEEDTRRYVAAVLADARVDPALRARLDDAAIRRLHAISGGDPETLRAALVALLRGEPQAPSGGEPIAARIAGDARPAAPVARSSRPDPAFRRAPAPVARELPPRPTPRSSAEPAALGALGGQGRHPGEAPADRPPPRPAVEASRARFGEDVLPEDEVFPEEVESLGLDDEELRPGGRRPWSPAERPPPADRRWLRPPAPRRLERAPALGWVLLAIVAVAAAAITLPLLRSQLTSPPPLVLPQGEPAGLAPPPLPSALPRSPVPSPTVAPASPPSATVVSPAATAQPASPVPSAGTVPPVSPQSVGSTPVAPSASAPAQPGALELFAVQIDARPWATIEIDGSVQGVTPLSNVPLPRGVHEFRARLSDGRVLERSIEIQSDRSILFE